MILRGVRRANETLLPAAVLSGILQLVVLGSWPDWPQSVARAVLLQMGGPDKPHAPTFGGWGCCMPWTASGARTTTRCHRLPGAEQCAAGRPGGQTATVSETRAACGSGQAIDESLAVWPCLRGRIPPSSSVVGAGRWLFHTATRRLRVPPQPLGHRRDPLGVGLGEGPNLGDSLQEMLGP